MGQRRSLAGSWQQRRFPSLAPTPLPHLPQFTRKQTGAARAQIKRGGRDAGRRELDAARRQVRQVAAERDDVAADLAAVRGSKLVADREARAARTRADALHSELAFYQQQSASAMVRGHVLRHPRHPRGGGGSSAAPHYLCRHQTGVHRVHRRRTAQALFRSL